MRCIWLILMICRHILTLKNRLKLKNSPSVKSTIIIALNLLLITGCSFNDVNLLTNFEPPAQDRAIIIFGLGVESKLREPSQWVSFHEYSLEKQAATQACFLHHNHASAEIENKPNEFRYFAFDVAPGYYALDVEQTYHTFEKTPLAKAAKAPAYKVPAGKIVYLGDYIYSNRNVIKPPQEHTLAFLKSQEPKITPINDSKNATVFIKSLFPKYKEELVLSEPKMVKPPVMMLCAP